MRKLKPAADLSALVLNPTKMYNASFVNFFM